MPKKRTLVGTAGLCVVALAATAAPVTTAGAAPAAPDRTIDLLSAAPATARTRALAADAGAARSRSVDLDTGALRAAVVGDRIDLRLFDDLTVSTEIVDRTTAGGVTSWTGTLGGEDGSFSAVQVPGATHVNLTSTEHGTFEVSSTRDGDYVVVEAGATPPGGADDAVDPGHGDHAAPDAVRPRAGAGQRASTAAGDAPTTIDVAIVYPAALVSQMGAAPMQAQFAQGIAQTNEALRSSGIGTQVRLVGTRQVASAQQSSLQANITALGTPGDGVFDEAQALREETHADLVSLWLADSVPPGASCGIGSLGGSYPESDPERAAWTVVYADACATQYRVFSHELGHNLSADHDAGAASPPLSSSKPYARGYVDVPAKTITVMSYYEQCVAAGVSCTRIGYYSSPAVQAAGRPQGTTTPPTDNVRAISEQVNAVANYRQSQIYPGSATVTGRARFKGVAIATSTPWSPAVTLGYQWYVDGVPVAGATAGTYRLARRDIGRSLTVQVTGSAPYYAPVATGSAPVVVGKALFRTKRPTIRGPHRVGRLLSVRLKGWKPGTGSKKVKVRYQWFRNGKKIKGARKATYRVRGKDRGKKLTVRVQARKKYYEKATRTSRKVKIRR